MGEGPIIWLEPLLSTQSAAEEQKYVSRAIRARRLAGPHLTSGVGIIAFIAAFACLIGMRFAARRPLPALTVPLRTPRRLIQPTPSGLKLRETPDIAE